MEIRVCFRYLDGVSGWSNKVWCLYRKSESGVETTRKLIVISFLCSILVYGLPSSLCSAILESLCHFASFESVSRSSEFRSFVGDNSGFSAENHYLRKEERSTSVPGELKLKQVQSSCKIENTMREDLEFYFYRIRGVTAM